MKQFGAGVQNWYDHFRTIVNDEFGCPKISKQKIVRTIVHLKLREASESDGILKKIFKSFRSVIITRTVKPVNTTFNRGLCLKEWTRRKSIAFHKKGSTSASDTYIIVETQAVLRK